MTIVSRFCRRRAAIAAALITVLVAGVCPAMSADYEDLVAEAKAGKTIDYAALRIAYAESKVYDAYGSDIVSLRGPFQKAFADGDCASAISQGQSILEKNYVYVDAHFILGICHRRLGQTEPSERHTATARGLVRAILATGDGKAPESAFVVISVSEEYIVIGLQGAKKLQQALISKNGHSYDVMTVENKSGAKEQIYFNVDRVLRWSTEKLVPKK